MHACALPAIVSRLYGNNMSGIFKTQHSPCTHHVPGSPVIDPELQRGLDIHPGQVTAHPQPLAAGQPAHRHTGDLGRDPGRLWGDYHHYYGSRTHDLKRWTLLPRVSIGNAAVTIFWPCVPEERRDENCSGQQNFRDHSPALAPYLIILAQYNSLFSLDGGGSKDVYTRSGTSMYIHFWEMNWL